MSLWTREEASVVRDKVLNLLNEMDCLSVSQNITKKCQSTNRDQSKREITKRTKYRVIGNKHTFKWLLSSKLAE